MSIPSLIWRSPATHGTPPAARYGHSATRHGNTMIVFGGESSETDTPLGDVHLLNLETWEWQSPVVSGEMPSSRAFHSAVLVQDHLVVWGGYDRTIDGGYEFSDTDVYLLDLKTWQWSRRTPVGTPPTARAHHSAILLEDQLFVDGGSFDIYSVWNDSYVLDLQEMRWRAIATENAVNTALAGLKIHGNTLVKFLGDGAYNGFSGQILTLDLAALTQAERSPVPWQTASMQELEPPNRDMASEDDEDWDENDDLDADEEEYWDEDEWDGGIPYRTIHGYGEFGHHLVLYAGMAPGGGVSHDTIGDLVLLELPSADAAQSGTYIWRSPLVEGNTPPPRFGHSTIQYNSQMIVYGGKWLDMEGGEHSYDNEVYILEHL